MRFSYLIIVFTLIILALLNVSVQGYFFKKLPNGRKCKSHSQCVSKYCRDGICSSRISQPLIMLDEMPFPYQHICTEDYQCESNYCKDGRCTRKEETSILGDLIKECTSTIDCKMDKACINSVCVDKNNPDDSNLSSYSRRGSFSSNQEEPAECHDDTHCEEQKKCEEGICVLQRSSSFHGSRRRNLNRRPSW